VLCMWEDGSECVWKEERKKGGKCVGGREGKKTFLCADCDFAISVPLLVASEAQG